MYKRMSEKNFAFSNQQISLRSAEGLLFPNLMGRLTMWSWDVVTIGILDHRRTRGTHIFRFLGKVLQETTDQQVLTVC